MSGDTSLSLTACKHAICISLKSLRTCDVQGCQIVEQLDMDSSCGPCFTQTQGNVSLPVMDRLKQMHYFLVGYMRDTVAEE